MSRAHRFGGWNALWALGAGVAAIAVVLLHRPDLQPIFHDRAYLLYMAQGVHRGEPIYSTSSFGYPPLWALLAAASMGGGGWLGISSYVAPRCLSLLVAASSAGLLFVSTRRATLSPATAAFAVVALLSFDLFTHTSAESFEPKLLVQLLVLGAIVGLQRRRWGWVGFAMGAAVTTWQPAAMSAVVFAGLAWGERRSGGLRHFLGGALLGALPSMLYLTATAQWPDVYRQALVWKLTAVPGAPQGGWGMAFAQVFRGRARLLLGLAGAGLIVTLATPVLRPRHSARRMWLHPRAGGLPLLTATWLGYIISSHLSPLEIKGRWDLLPFLYLVAFWSALACLRAAVWLKRQARAARPGWKRVTDLALPVAALVLAAVTAFHALRYAPPITLALEKEIIASVLREGSARASIVTVDAEEVLVLTERRSPWPVLSLSPRFVELIGMKHPRGCRALIEDVDEHGPGLVVVGRTSHGSRCRARLLGRLAAEYREVSSGLAGRRYRVFWRREERP